MDESKNSFAAVIVIILIIALAISVVMIFKSNNIKQEEVSAGLTNEMTINEETNTKIENEIEENTAMENRTVKNEKETVSKAETSKNTELTSEEKKEIEQYVNKICNKIKKIDEFSDINKANKEWIYSHLLTNGKKYGNYLTEEQITKDLKEIFGTNLKIDIKNDTKSADGYFIPLNIGNGKYEFLPTGGMIQVEYAIDSIKKENNIFVVNLVEYSVQFDMETENPELNNAVFSYNKSKWSKIFSIKNENDTEIRNKVLTNKDKFETYNLFLERSKEGRLFINRFEKSIN